jgi:hypothetical protein
MVLGRALRRTGLSRSRISGGEVGVGVEVGGVGGGGGEGGGGGGEEGGVKGGEGNLGCCRSFHQSAPSSFAFFP